MPLTYITQVDWERIDWKPLVQYLEQQRQELMRALKARLARRSDWQVEVVRFNTIVIVEFWPRPHVGSRSQRVDSPAAIVSQFVADRNLKAWLASDPRDFPTILIYEVKVLDYEPFLKQTVQQRKRSLRATASSS